MTGRPKARPYTEKDAERDRLSLQRLHAGAHDSRILGLLAVGHTVAHIIRVGEYQRSWTARDVQEALRRNHIAPPPPPFGGGARPRLNAKVVQLPESHVDVVREMCTGAGIDAIGERLFMSRPTVLRHVSAICTALGAEDRAHAIALVMGGWVRITLPKPL